MADTTTTDTSLDAVTVTATPIASTSTSTITGSPGTAANANIGTDNVFQNIRLYIEGVEVPFIAISISSAIGTLPSASIEVPPQAGLMDIARYYQPKVHIFFTDNILGGDRLLFWGHIKNVSYQRSKGSGSASIQFNCLHKNDLVRGLTLDYTGYTAQQMSSPLDVNPNNAAIKVNAPNSTLGIITALQGISGLQSLTKDVIDATNTAISDADVTKLEESLADFEKRLNGMTGVVLNFWNQIKVAAYALPTYNQTFIKLYLPLLEQGLAYFERMSGHYSLEIQVENNRQEYCPHSVPASAIKYDVLVPHSRKVNNISAVQAALAVESVNSIMSYSGEMMDFATLINNFLYSVEYELVTLASPATTAVDPTQSVDPDDATGFATTERSIIESVVKPQTPFYYAPLCNVVFPHMFSSISVSQMEDQVPTRIVATHDMISSAGSSPTSINYYAPASIRESISIASNTSTSAPTSYSLKASTLNTYNVPGKYEQARGILARKVLLPQWLAMYVADNAQSANVTGETWPATGTAAYTDLVAQHSCWVDRYGYNITTNDGTVTRTRNTSKDSLDPNSPISPDIQPMERILFDTADYEFTKQVAQSRAGSIEGIFNPYIIAGYPMDIIDSSPNYPSFHAMCGSVTHSITSSSISTTIGFMAATTYAEMSNYYMQPLHPWLQLALNMNNPTYSDADASTTSASNYGAAQDVSTAACTLINNPTAKAAADDYYRSVLGIGCADPSIVYDFSAGDPTPVARSNGIWQTGSSIASGAALNGAETNDNKSAMGNLRLVSRQIEAKADITTRFGINFIDLTPTNYTQDGANYYNPILDESILLEPGASMFVDYVDSTTFLASTTTATTTTSS